MTDATVTRISVIILTWNGRQYLKDCLESLAAQTFHNFETILLDNGSHDGTEAYVREAFPWVRSIRLPENSGFAAGNNMAFAECRSEFIVTLNNDTMVDSGFLAELLKSAEADLQVGMVAAKMLNFFEKDRIDSVGVSVAPNGMGHNIGVGEQNGGQYDQPSEVFGPCAGAALYRREMLDETGFFDPDFFAYYEDLDLAWRGRLAGWRCVTAPGAVVHHVHSASSGRMSEFTVFHTHRNKWFVIIKNWPASLIFRQLPLILAYDAAALLLSVLKGRIRPALSARFHVLMELPNLLRKRSQVAEMRKIPMGNIQQLFVPAASPLKTLRRKMGSGV
ncbi:MAG: glycosyltransferase family 2 protein [Desulfuromonadales bacterium]